MSELSFRPALDFDYAFLADAFNHPAQFPHPEWPSGSDEDHEIGRAHV